MKSPDGITVPLWKDAGDPPRHPEPPSDLRADVVIVGAGIAGLTTAYLLAKAGRSVAVIDMGPVGAGQTQRTTAHLASAIDDRFQEIERLHGADGARLQYQSNAAAIDFIESTSQSEEIDCHFRRLDGLLFLAPGQAPDALDKELAAAHRAGFTSAQILENGSDLPADTAVATGGTATPPASDGRCIRFPNQGRFHPVKYIHGLARAVERHGGKIYTGKRVEDVSPADPAHGTPPTLTLEGGAKVTASFIVVAANATSGIGGWVGGYTKQAPYRTYVVALKVPREAVPDVLWWDDGEPYHYVRLEGSPPQMPGREDHDVLIVGGEDHKTGQMPADAAAFLNLETWAKKMFPAAGDVVTRWSGQVQEPADMIPLIGAAPGRPGVFVITGDSGMGMTHGTLGGMIVSDLVLGRENPWAQLYDPGRKTLTKDFVSENINAVAHFREYVTAGEVSSIEEIPPGHGAVVREGLHKIACYRDRGGGIHRYSASCPHVGCIVHWNNIEHTWDCPCHGSRFDPRGGLLMGPASTGLNEAPEASEPKQ